MRRVRAEINLPGMQAGTEHDVDETEPQTAAMISEGLLSLLEHRSRVPCFCCEPPTFWDTEDGRAIHFDLDHPGEAGCDGQGGRFSDSGVRRDPADEVGSDPGAAGA